MTSRVLESALSALAQSGLLAVGVVRDGTLVATSAALRQLFELPDGPAPFWSLVAEADQPRLVEALTKAGRPDVEGSATLGFEGVRTTGAVFNAELWLARVDLPDGPAVALMVSDVTTRRRAEAQLSYLAFLDALTGLPNRALFLDRLHGALASSRRYGGAFAVLACDLDGFKAVNDTHGHEAGDVVLAQVARRLERSVRESDTVARLGGDEFAGLLSRISLREDAALVAGRVVRAMAEPIDLGSAKASVGISVGIATYPTEGETLDGLLAAADSAMYASKRAGKNRYTFATSTVDPRPLPFLQWSSAHEVGHPGMDAEHRQLAGLLNRLGEDLKAGRDRDAILASLAALVTATVEHFAHEEALMRAHPGFPREIQHIQAHRSLVDDVQSLTLTVDASSMTMTMRFLVEWLLRHIDALDRPLARWLQRGPKPIPPSRL